MAYSDSFPAVRPVFQSDFANGGRIDPRISYSRSTTGTYFGTDKHLSSENLIKHSEGSAVWGGTATITYGYTNGPDGVTGTALRLESASGTERYRYSTGGQFVSGTAYTVSCWVKSNTGVAQTFRFMCSTTANQSADLTTHATDWTRVTATITPNTTNIFAGFVFLSANTNDISVWGLQVNTGSDELDYQATTTQIHREYAPTLQTAAINAPRFEFSASDSASMGLLIEGSSTNLVTYSSDITQSFFTGLRSTRESTVGIAPDGTLTADLLREDSTASNSHGMLFGYNSGGTTPQTISVYAKAAGRNHLSFRFEPTNGVFGGDYVWFNLSTGAVGTTDSDITASIVSCGNGWYRCIATRTALASGNGYVIFYLSDADNSISYSGNSYSGIMLWGAQAEANSSFASSLISTSGSAVTRAADSASAVTSDIGYTGGPVTVVGEFSLNTDAISSSATVVQLTSTGGNDRAYIYQDQSNERLYGVIQSDGGYPASKDLLGAAAVSGTNYKFAFSADTNDYKAVVNNGTVHTDTDMQLPNEFDKLAIGYNFHGGAGQINGHYKRLAIYSNGMTATNVSALTS